MAGPFGSLRISSRTTIGNRSCLIDKVSKVWVLPFNFGTFENTGLGDASKSRY
jgi:hypothetical protein